MKELSQEKNHEALAERNSSDSFIATSALTLAVEHPETWGYEEFRRCRTFVELKSLARSRDLKALNDFGRIQLFRDKVLVGSFWLFD